MIDMESYKIVFDLFDRDHSGYIDNIDLQEIAQSLNRDPNEGKISVLIKFTINLIHFTRVFYNNILRLLLILKICIHI